MAGPEFETQPCGGDHREIVLTIEPVAPPEIEECPVCGHMSRYTVMAVLTSHGTIVGGPAKYARCAEGCDDGEITLRGRST